VWRVDKIEMCKRDSEGEGREVVGPANKADVRT
jgi:hypothetical protein